MTDTPRQLSLAVRLKDRASFSNFHPGRNREVLMALSSLSDRENYQDIFPGWFISGGSASGKSHLLFSVLNATHAQGKPALYLSCDQLLSEGPLDDVPGVGVLCLDRVDAISGDTELEQSLFGLFERVRDNTGVLVMAATRPATELGIKLQDLVSRLSQAISYQLQELSDQEKSQAFKLRAEVRGMTVTEEVVQYILKRSTRDMHSLFDLLDRIDIQSLAEQRRITIPFLRKQGL